MIFGIIDAIPQMFSLIVNEIRGQKQSQLLICKFFVALNYKMPGCAIDKEKHVNVMSVSENLQACILLVSTGFSVYFSVHYFLNRGRVLYPKLGTL